jgi:hypothetical protein
MATEGYVKFEYFSKAIPPYYNHSSFPELIDDERITIESPSLELSYHQYASMFKKFLMAIGFSQKNVMQAGCSLAFNEGYDEKVMREVAEEYDLIMSEDLPDIIQDKIKQDVEWVEKHEKSWEKRYWALYHTVKKSNSNDIMPPWGHSDMEALKYSDEELNAMCDRAASEEEKKKCQEYNLREAEYYNKRAELDSSFLAKDRNSNFPSENTIIDEDNSNKDMWDQGMMKVTTNDPMKAWNGYIPGSPEAVAAGCICPVLDNEDMPDDKKWIDVECPIHGRRK